MSAYLYCVVLRCAVVWRGVAGCGVVYLCNCGICLHAHVWRFWSLVSLTLTCCPGFTRWLRLLVGSFFAELSMTACCETLQLAEIKWALRPVVDGAAPAAGDGGDVMPADARAFKDAEMIRLRSRDVIATLPDVQELERYGQSLEQLRSVSFMTESGKTEGPYFLYLWHSHVFEGSIPFVIVKASRIAWNVLTGKS